MLNISSNHSSSTLSAGILIFSIKYHNECQENTNGVIRSRKSKKNRQYNVQNKIKKRMNNDLQNTIQKTTD